MTEPLERLLLAVEDIDIAREDLIARGVDVSEIWHTVPGQPPATGVHRSATRTPAGRRSRTRTATGGSCRRSPRGSRAACRD